MKVTRIYERVSIDKQGLTLQSDIENKTQSEGYDIAGIYREKISGAQTDRPGFLRMINNFQPGDGVIAKKIQTL